MSVKLKIEEFWASEEYYFHSEEQMELAAQFCPDIRKMLFMFQGRKGDVKELNPEKVRFPTKNNSKMIVEF